MSERPNVVLAALFTSAAFVAALVGSGLVLLGTEGAEEVGATVVSALSACIFFLLGPEHIPFSSVVIVVVALASVGALAVALRGYRAERRLLRALALDEIVDGPLARRARDAGVRLFLLPASRPAAFCVGLLRPRVVVSAGLLARLDGAEQEAVVWHEAAHARSREPLKCLLGRLATQTFFWIPVLRGFLDRYLLVKEMAADRAAVARTSRRALAGALSQVLAEPTPAGAVGLAEFAAARVDRLFGLNAPLPRFISPRQAVVSAVSVAALVLALVFPATLNAGESDRIWHMLSTMSPHGLPGMLIGLAANVAALVGATLLGRRLAR